VLAEVEPLIARSKLTVTTQVDDDAAAPLRSDRQKVKQIVINLLTNALKFTPQGWVTVTAACDPVTDRMAIAGGRQRHRHLPEGPGRVFEDFRQADDSPTRQYTGAGLGLAICRRLARCSAAELEACCAARSARARPSPRAPAAPETTDDGPGSRHAGAARRRLSGQPRHLRAVPARTRDFRVEEAENGPPGPRQGLRAAGPTSS
jgi:hypothetical protein